MKTAVKRTNDEVLATWQRWAELLIVVATLLLFGFFAYHQLTSTGFFTAKFGSLEMFFLYGPILLSLAAPVARAWIGRRNPARPVEAAANLFLGVGSVWLLIVFPFNFSHLADVLPGAIRFVLSWVTNDIGKIPLILQVIVGLISALSTTWKYLSVRRREPANPSQQQSS
jgi:hypothetical protein